MVIGAHPRRIAAPHRAAPARGFTLIELLVVMAVLALLLSLATPRYFGSVDRAREAVLRQNLGQVRDAIDKYHADTGTYPPSLEQLVSRRYLRSLPFDPFTESTDTWTTVPPPDGQGNGVYDLRSGAPGRAPGGTAFADL